jgi:methyltransferase
MVTKIAFTVLVGLVALQRLIELRISRRHERTLKACGGVEHAARQMPWMVAVHTGWLVCMLLEVWRFPRPFYLPVALPAFVAFVIGQALRVSAMRALGTRWTVRVITVPEPPVVSGIFHYLRHPNYTGVVLEVAALPLVHGAYLTAGFFTLANALLLVFRIRAEEHALEQSSDYGRHFRERAQFLSRREN